MATKIACQVAAAVLGLTAARQAAAVELGSVGDAPPAQLHGFVSPGFIFSTENNYLAKSTRGSFEFNEVGVNLTVPLSDKLRTGMQLFSRDLGPVGNYTPKFDWFYLDYRFEDWLGLRAGRVKVPFGLYNDSSDIDAARVPVLLPQSIYPAGSRDFLLAQTGAEIYGRVDMGVLGALEYRIFGGTIFLDLASQTSVGTQVSEIDVPYVVGERLLWETPLEGLRLGATLEALRLDARFVVPPATEVDVEVPAVLWVWSAEYVAYDWLVAAEYSRWMVSIHADPAIVPPDTTTSERAYAMASYGVTDWFHPGAYYSLFFPNVENRSGRAAVQHDVAGTLRFDVNEHWLVKLEGHYMRGTADVDESLNDNQPLDTLARNWAVFLAKTTAHF